MHVFNSTPSSEVIFDILTIASQFLDKEEFAHVDLDAIAEVAPLIADFMARYSTANADYVDVVD